MPNSIFRTWWNNSMINQDCKIWYILDIPSPNSTQMICNEWAAFQLKLPRAFRCGFFPFSLSASFCILYADFTFDKKESEVCSREQRLSRITKTSSLHQVWSLTQLKLCSVASKGHRKKWVFTYQVYFPPFANSKSRFCINILTVPCDLHAPTTSWGLTWDANQYFFNFSKCNHNKIALVARPGFRMSSIWGIE